MRMQTFVNPEKRTVVVVIDETQNDVRRAVGKLFRHPKLRESFRFFGSESYLVGPHSGAFRGIARCHPDDTWDETEGIKIATERATRQYRRAFNREVINLMDILEDYVLSNLQDMIDYSVEDHF